MHKNQLDKYMERLQLGNEDAFDIIYEEMHKGVYVLILSVLKEKYSAEDITQNTFVKLRTNISQYKLGTNPVAWILTIAKSLAINEFNRKKRDIPTDFNSLEMQNTCGAYDIDFLLDRQILKTAMTKLTERERTVVLMHAVAGYKHREIAEILELTQSNTLWIYHNSLKKLKVALQEEDYE